MSSPPRYEEAGPSGSRDRQEEQEYQFVVHREDYEDHEDYGDREDRPFSPSRRGSPIDARRSLASFGNSREILEIAERIGRSSRGSRRSGTERELIKLLLSEEVEFRRMRSTLYLATNNLETERRRAHEAERRALELARDFKTVNDARITAQNEVNRLSAELNLYKMQLANAQSELERGQDTLRDLELQRDDAEAAAARARSTARRLREQQQIFNAREEGRREGFAEGMRFAEARMSGYSRRRSDEGDSIHEDEPTYADAGRPPPLDEISPELNNFLPSARMNDPPPRGYRDPPPGSIFEEQIRATIPPQNAFSRDTQGSRFRENMASPGASTLRSVPPSLRVGPLSNAPQPQGDGNIHPRVVRTASPTPSHPDYTVPPDGWIPSIGDDNRISLPPPHELNERPPPSPRTPQSPLPTITVDETGFPTPSQVVARDYAYPNQRSSPVSMADSVASTSMSHLSILAPPRNSATRERLSAIPEAELSTSTEGRLGNAMMPEPLVFPAASTGTDTTSRSDRRPSRPERSDYKSVRSTSRRAKSRYRSEESLSDVSSLTEQSIRQSAHAADPAQNIRLSSPFDRPYSSASYNDDNVRFHQSQSVNSVSDTGSSGQRRASGSVTISVQPPSGSEQSCSPLGAESGRLTPSSSMRTVSPSRPYIPAEPTTLNLRSMPSMGPLGSGFPPPGFVTMEHPMPAPYQPPPQMPTSQIEGSLQLTTDPSVVPIRPASRTNSLAAHREDRLRPTTPSYRPPSATPSQSSRPRSPSQLSYSPNGQPMTAPPYQSLPVPPNQPLPIPAPDGSRPSSQPRYMPESNRPQTPNQPRYIREPERPYTSDQPKYIIPPDASRRGQRSSRQPPAGSASPGPSGVPRPASTLNTVSPRSSTSRLSVNMNAGATPAAFSSRPLSGGGLRHMASTSSFASTTSRKSGYGRYDPSTYLDAAYLASSEDLRLPGS
ncbi:hypothetical protein WOLCODRAFT_150938 [Wolfiporia cocos MD-104 SS10]|uniref:Uncharacterized protein n=1 Tax=Wolfiporia cocos (strain MD-104) TaxID=742152 RepID=A0A2H3JM16_WOLCO|nr:hypothetical protein WOLCODRAFT_150938 [Wolfiporia cocos MD-104 SS10]